MSPLDRMVTGAEATWTVWLTIAALTVLALGLAWACEHKGGKR